MVTKKRAAKKAKTTPLQAWRVTEPLATGPMPLGALQKQLEVFFRESFLDDAQHASSLDMDVAEKFFKKPKFSDPAKTPETCEYFVEQGRAFVNERIESLSKALAVLKVLVETPKGKTENQLGKKIDLTTALVEVYAEIAAFRATHRLIANLSVPAAGYPDSK